MKRKMERSSEIWRIFSLTPPSPLKEKLLSGVPRFPFTSSERKRKKNIVDALGIDPSTFRMLSKRSSI